MNTYELQKILIEKVGSIEEDIKKSSKMEQYKVAEFLLNATHLNPIHISQSSCIAKINYPNDFLESIIITPKDLFSIRDSSNKKNYFTPVTNTYLWPISIEKITLNQNLLTINFYSKISLNLLFKLGFCTLPLYFDSNNEISRTIHNSIYEKLSSIRCKADDMQNKLNTLSCVSDFLNLEKIEVENFSEKNNILTRYSLSPELFQFISIKAPFFLSESSQQKFEFTFEFSESLDIPKQSIGNDTIQLNCIGLRNLFKRQINPFKWDFTNSEQKLEVVSQYEDSPASIISLQDIALSMNGNSISCAPFFEQHYEDRPDVLYSLHRTLSDDEAFLSLNFTKSIPNSAVLVTGQAWCSNQSLSFIQSISLPLACQGESAVTNRLNAQLITLPKQAIKLITQPKDYFSILSKPFPTPLSLLSCNEFKKHLLSLLPIKCNLSSFIDSITNIEQEVIYNRCHSHLSSRLRTICYTFSFELRKNKKSPLSLFGKLLHHYLHQTNMISFGIKLIFIAAETNTLMWQSKDSDSYEISDTFF